LRGRTGHAEYHDRHDHQDAARRSGSFTWKSTLNVFMAITAVLVGLLLGPLGGLIPLAVLTTRHRQKSSKQVAGVFE
jgi:hypothetical protein